MRRKVNAVGTGTLTLSLPMGWVKRCRIKKGDELFVKENPDGSLHILLEEFKSQDLKKSFSSKGLLSFLDKFVAALYKAGYDELHIQYSSQEELDVIQKLLQKTCLGFEVTELTKKTITIKSVSKLSVDDFDSLLKRLFNILIGITEELYDAVKSKDDEALSSIILRHNLINRYADLCRRLINTGPHHFVRPGPLYYVVESVEKISHMYRLFTEQLLQEGIHKADLAKIKLVNDHFRSAKLLFYDYSREGMASFISQKEVISNKIDDPLLKSIAQYIFYMNGSINVLKE
ncbi:TPA: phosphate uptake regulator PhoU [Candidatus Woesearchaeota archaeon]|nr:phosphate uptake regulator PhoU [Candidatus Woesearchaeota archaeon]